MAANCTFETTACKVAARVVASCLGARVAGGGSSDFARAEAA
jgi:hypothetical protein